MTRPGFEPGPLRWEAGDQPPELWRGQGGGDTQTHREKGDLISLLFFSLSLQNDDSRLTKDMVQQRALAKWQ
jgi:hypothetical protein